MASGKRPGSLDRSVWCVDLVLAVPLYAGRSWGGSVNIEKKTAFESHLLMSAADTIHMYGL